ncbi:sporulation protein [Paenibacillus flagellatus]|uniref:Sporulation protein n=1 Tax=Paenibacillus flagellatus TaxID=2211139 RepID=A0A2V5K502_9BACL|nr:sporulation protein [Paenibacillus flagellatus]PYI53812.1 sporulation protein [Paenibacillus flagellatus]
MSLFNRMLASIGIGGAKVDTKLERGEYAPGEEVRGVVHIRGGSVEQEIGSIYILVMTQYVKEHDDRKYTENYALAKIRVSDRMTLRANDSVEVPFAFELPVDTPATIGGQPVWLRTGLDIEMAVDPSDDDAIRVRPHPHAETVLAAAERLGCRLKSARCEYARYGRGGVPFVQEFEFYPGHGYGSRMTELELVFFPRPGGLDVLVEVDRRARGLTGFLEQAFDMDERKQVLRLGAAELNGGPDAIAHLLAETIERHTY